MSSGTAEPFDDFSPEESAITMGVTRPWGKGNFLNYGDGQGRTLSGVALLDIPADVEAVKVRVTNVEATLAKAVLYQDDGSIHFPAGTKMQVDLGGGVTKDVLSTDSNGNILIGEGGEEVNILASMRPTITVGGGNPQGIATTDDLGAYASLAQVDAKIANKADLDASGRLPDTQLPLGIKSQNFTVPTEADLTTLTTAVVNDRAKVTATDEIWLLWQLPPTTAGNWENLTQIGPVQSVAGKTGNVSLAIGDINSLQASLDAKANSSALSSYAPIASPTFTGAPKAPTPAANASSTEMVTAAWARTYVTGNFGSSVPPAVGTGSTGSATTAARSDHTHSAPTNGVTTARTINTTAPLTGGGDMSADRTLGISAAGAATTAAAGSAGSAVYAPDNAAATVRNQAATPAGIAAAFVNMIKYSTSGPSGSATAGAIWLVYE